MRRWHLVALLLLAAFAALSLSLAQAPGERYALLVGVRKYDKNELRDLKYSEADVTGLADVLEQSGYRERNIVLLTQTRGAEDDRFLPRADHIREEVRLLLKGLRENDSVVLAFAGHGVQFKGSDEVYFCPSGTRLEDRKTLVSLTEIYEQLKQCKAGFKLLLVDACRNDPQTDSSRALSRVQLESVTRPAKQQPPGGVAALFSCSAGEKAYEHDELKHGVFFHFVINGLRGGADTDRDGKVTLAELEGYTQKEVYDFVRAEYRREQQPERIGSTRGVVPLVVLEGTSQEITNSIGMTLRLIPAGTFRMGSPKTEEDRRSDEDEHEVEISEPFYLGIHEVTQEQYERVMGTNPARFTAAKGGGPRHPVEQVSHDDAVEFCRKLTERERQHRGTYRLPTEAEWEYACRGGARGRTAFHFGNSLDSTQANFNGNFPYGGATEGAYRQKTTKVGSFPPNAFGLHDMHGNVGEWCADWYARDYYGSSPRVGPRGPTEGTARVVRGGGLIDFAQDCRTAFRNSYEPSRRNHYVGFRLALVPAARR